MINARFKFTGNTIIPKEDCKRPFFRKTTFTEKGTEKKRKALAINFGVKESGGNAAFVESFGGVMDTIITFNSDNERIEVDWEDRFDEEIVADVASYRKYVVDLGEDFGGRKEFITQYDFNEFLGENLPKFDGRVVATGDYAKTYYDKNKTYYDKYTVRGVYAAKENSASRLSLMVDLYYSKDSVDKGDWKEDKKIYVNGYIMQYVNKDEGTKLFPMQTVFSGAKYDVENNERHKKLLDYKMSYIDIKGKKYVHIPWDIVIINGAEEVEFDESMLTKKQKEQIELGLKTLEDFKPNGSIYGDRVNEFRLFDPRLIGDFADGLLECDETNKEIEEMIYAPVQEKTMEQALKESKDKEEAPFDVDDEDIDDDDLF